MRNWSTAVVLASLVAVSACNDTTTSPRGLTPADTAAKPAVQGSQASLSMSFSISFNFTINPAQATVIQLGSGNSLVIPAHTLCDPSSQYGPAYWDAPCTLATQPLTVVATAGINSAGNVWVDFNQHIRFAPSTNPAQWVVINFSSWSASQNPLYNIYYCPTVGQTCVDESASDPSLLPTRNPSTGQIYRRVKHFSGYNVAAGLDDASIGISVSFSLSPRDLTLTNVGEVQSAYPFLSANASQRLLETIYSRRLSGYILASGRGFEDDDQ